MYQTVRRDPNAKGQTNQYMDNNTVSLFDIKQGSKITHESDEELQSFKIDLFKVQEIKNGEELKIQMTNRQNEDSEAYSDG